MKKLYDLSLIERNDVAENTKEKIKLQERYQ